MNLSVLKKEIAIKKIIKPLIIWSAVFVYLFSFALGFFGEDGLNLGLEVILFAVILYAIPLMFIWPQSFLFAFVRSLLPFFFWIVYLIWFSNSVEIGAGGLGLAITTLWFAGLSLISLIIGLITAFFLRANNKK